ncbi:molybdopterin-dependent oxidoreductase [Saliphagus infecundisoli]|uniref:Molybdopterin-dependent oxidoreductase n=1 Tax=Saliphagus infecundisoli TaxID=1849069 RepID=A0ABD5QL10_9EURY
MGVTFVGQTSIEVDPEDFPTDELRETFQCSSGEPIPGEWHGVPIRSLIDVARVSSGTTHARIRGSDGFTVCLPIGTVIDGLIAFDRRPLDDSRTVTDANFPRFVAPGISGIRTVKSVDRVETIQLDSNQEAQEFENLLLDS